MTREQAKQVLIGMGIEEPSDEQVSKYLDSVTGEVKKEKDKNALLQEKVNKAADLEKELEELKQQNMTDAEKAELERQKEKAANEKRISDLESALATSQREALTGKITSIFANAGMQGDAYAGANDIHVNGFEELIKSFKKNMVFQMPEDSEVEV